MGSQFLVVLYTHCRPLCCVPLYLGQGKFKELSKSRSGSAKLALTAAQHLLGGLQHRHDGIAGLDTDGISDVENIYPGRTARISPRSGASSSGYGTMVAHQEPTCEELNDLSGCPRKRLSLSDFLGTAGEVAVPHP